MMDNSQSVSRPHINFLPLCAGEKTDRCTEIQMRQIFWCQMYAYCPYIRQLQYGIFSKLSVYKSVDVLTIQYMWTSYISMEHATHTFRFLCSNQAYRLLFSFFLPCPLPPSSCPSLDTFLYIWSIHFTLCKHRGSNNTDTQSHTYSYLPMAPYKVSSCSRQGLEMVSDHLCHRRSRA